uniref:ATP synthase complex subunit 8 n=1 Tax=Ventidius harrisoni TaxID=3095940 RepID=A0AB38Z6S4_9HEMI|nr:ATP synthase F0 subunit 8 [Ventidius harrisoni]WPW47142.1 ATP synthase F0 subunit 8 [Ventidius harrisoni]WPW47155.1 ATP synthase F0 subunit 8 [Ventidius harrisoni]
MPQMAPLYWMSLMILFIALITMVNTLMYFNKNYMTKNNLKEKQYNIMKWKW